MKIAVFLGDNGETISFNESGIIKVFLKEKEQWQIIKEIPFGINNLMNPKMARENIIGMLDALDECRVFVAAEVKGIPYTILESMKFNIWKVQGNPEDFLEYVFEKENQEKLNKVKSEVVPVPIEDCMEGKYYIDLKKVMESNEKVTSKQVLLPFLHNTNFNELEIDCGHVPPWFEVEFKKLNLKSSIEPIDEGGFKVKVYSKNYI